MDWYSPLVAKEEKIVIGLMSGTSLDGVDAAIVRIEGYGTKTKVEMLGFSIVPYDESLRERILAVCNPDTSRVDEICELNVRLAEKFADAALLAAKEANIDWETVDLISSHGQTIYHSPEKQATLQIGELAVIAERTGKAVVGDFRPHDMAVGGQGAPLVPYVDYLLFRDKERGRVLLNIGGIANISIVPAMANPEDIYAYDTGPGNMIIDSFIQFGTDGQKKYDESGNYAAQGKVSEQWLQSLLQHPYYSAPTPKSTGREMFGEQYARILWQDAQERGVSFVDRVATVTALTAYTIANQILKEAHQGVQIDDLIIAGGGQHNKMLLEHLQQLLPGILLQNPEAFGMSSDAKEAIAFAILGNDSIHRVPNQLPSATGAKKPVVMGKVVLP